MKLSSSISLALVSTAVLVTACSSSSSGGSSSGSGSASVQALATALCNFEQKCDSFNFQIGFGDQSTCVSVIAGSVGTSEPGLNYTDAALSACTSAINAADCSTTEDDIAACRVTGTLANGTGCEDSAQCSSGYCQATGSSSTSTATSDCGKCAPIAADGAPCVDDEGCNIGSACDQSKMVCGPRPAKGAACTPTGIACAGTSVCIANVCADPLPDGAACDDTQQQCSATSQCVNSKCTPESSIVGVADVGQPCGLDQAAEKETVCKFSSCVGAQGAQKCVAFAKEGEACAADDPTGANAQTLPDCGQNLDCTNGKCVAHVYACQ